MAKALNDGEALSDRDELDSMNSHTHTSLTGGSRSNTTKRDDLVQSVHLSIGHCSMQGVRESMEDAVVMKRDLQINQDRYALFAVFDGHGGSQCAKFLSMHLSRYIQTHLALLDEDAEDSHSNLHTKKMASHSYTKPNSIEEAMEHALSAMDADCLDVDDGSGSTGVIVLINKFTNHMWVANVGDSRAILISKSISGMGGGYASSNSNGTTNKMTSGDTPPIPIGDDRDESVMSRSTSGLSTSVIPHTQSQTHSMVRQLSVEHKPGDPSEKERIEKAEGWVAFNRVMGILAVSRSFGDKDFKTHLPNLVTAVPSITHHILQPVDTFIVIACDGLFDVFTNEEVYQFLTIATEEFPDLSIEELAKDLVTDSIYNRKSRDNVSLILVRLDVNESASMEQRQIPMKHKLNLQITMKGGGDENGTIGGGTGGTGERSITTTAYSHISTLFTHEEEDGEENEDGEMDHERDESSEWDGSTPLSSIKITPGVKNDPIEEKSEPSRAHRTVKISRRQMDAREDDDDDEEYGFNDGIVSMPMGIGGVIARGMPIGGGPAPSQEDSRSLVSLSTIDGDEDGNPGVVSDSE